MEKVFIDPKGDVCFVTTIKGTTIAGTDIKEQVGYVVSSKVLAISSDVFAALLGPNFREGRALANAGPGDPLQIPLPEDDPHGMKIVLDVIHHRPCPMKLDFEELKAVAKLVDKYQCAHVFQALSTIWLQEELLDSGLWEELPECLGIVIAFKNEEAFAAVSLGLAITTGRAWNSATTAERIEGTALADLVTSEICKEIDLHTRELRECFRDELNVLVEQVTNKPYEIMAYRQGHHLNQLCRHDEAVATGYFRHLFDIGILSSYQPVLRAALRLNKLKRLLSSDKALELVDYKKSDRSCTACSFMRDLEENLGEIFMNVIGRQNGKCLHCLGANQNDTQHWCVRRSEYHDRYSRNVKLLFGRLIDEALDTGATSFGVMDRIYDETVDWHLPR